MIPLIRALLVLVLLSIPLAHAEQTEQGSFPSGAHWRIAVPDGWQAGGPLVLYQHGFNFSEGSSSPSLGPLRDLMLAQGYAVAASSFSQRGWAVFRAMDDNRDLLDRFSSQFGAPGEIIPWGGSLGGLLALKLAEADGFPPVNGVMSICPAAAGSRLWEHALDLRLAYDVVCASAGDLPRGAEPMPWAYNLGMIPDDLGDMIDQAMVLGTTLLPLNQCTGINLAPAARSADKKRRLRQLMDVAGTDDEDFFLTNIAYSTYALSELLRASDKLDGGIGVGNIGVHYADAELDARIKRVAVDPIAASRLRWFSDFRGDIGNAKVLSLHTSGDELVVPANQDVLRQRIPAGQLTSAIVVEQEPTHCGFNVAEGLAGWQSLRAWMAGAAQPTVADLQQRCSEAVSQGAEGPCRFDPQFVVPSLDTVIPPRPADAAAVIDARYSGQWYDPSRSGEGIAMEVLPDQRVLVYFFTYPPAVEAGEQAWLIGSGPIVGNQVVIEDMRRPFMQADAVSGEDVLVSPHWGRLSLDFSDCQTGSMRWEGPAGWGTATVALKRLTSVHQLRCADGLDGGAQATGSWTDARFFGSGFLAEQLDPQRTALLWFSPGTSSDGQVWMTGVAQGDIAQGVVGQTLYATSGPNFGADYDPATLQAEPAMTLDLLLDCSDSGSGNYSTVVPMVGSDAILQLHRITRPAGIRSCP
ncbi:MAG: hypothetical protein ABIY56_05460 [Dokdonella sp.]